jgi:isopentenyl-diphosphate delta-isomerase
MEDQVILVDHNDQIVGKIGKMEAHTQGLLHRAFSIFIFNSKGELLLQQRALNKYHSAGKWTNTCCSHPKPNEDTLKAAQRRLNEEMGMHCELTYGFSFTYKALFTNGLIEHEYDHVFFGLSDELPVINHEEVVAFNYINLTNLTEELKQNPDIYSAWLKVCFNKVIKFKNDNYE